MHQNLYLSREHIEALATLHHATPQVKHDREMTPSLTGVLITCDGIDLEAVATDRYLVARLNFELIPRSTSQAWSSGEKEEHRHEPITFLFPSTLLQEAAKRKLGAVISIAPGRSAEEILAANDGPVENADRAFITLSFDDGNELTFFEPAIAAKYAPVARLFPSFEAAGEGLEIAPGTGIDFSRFARIEKLRTPSQTLVRPKNRATYAVGHFSISATTRADGLAQVLFITPQKSSELASRGESLSVILQTNRI